MIRQLKPHEMAEPGTPEHSRMTTASKVAAMLRDPNTGEFLGLGYDSAYDTYLYMTGQAEKNIDGMEDHFLYGHSVEKAARHWWLEKNPGWRISPGEVAFTDDDLPYPNQVTLDLRASRGRTRRIIEVKAPRVDRGVEDKWRVQVTDQMRTSGIHHATIIVWPVWGFPAAYDIEFDAQLAQAIVRDATHFHALIEAGTPPDAEDSGLFQEQAALTPVADLADDEDMSDLADEYADAVQVLTAAEKRLKTLDNIIIARLGNAPKATADGITLVRRQPGRFSQSRIPEEHKHLLEDPALLESKFSARLLKAQHPDIYAESLGPDTFTFSRKEFLQ